MPARDPKLEFHIMRVLLFEDQSVSEFYSAFPIVYSVSVSEKIPTTIMKASK